MDSDLGGPYPLNPPGQPVNQPQTRNYPSQPPPPTEAYRILRGPRAMPGEPVLTLPKDVGIDISRGPSVDPSNPNGIPTFYRLFPLGNTNGNGPFDILFDPSGRLIGPASTLGNRVCLWVRDISTELGPTQLPDGDNTLITIYARTGQITAHPIDPSGLQLNTLRTQQTVEPVPLHARREVVGGPVNAFGIGKAGEIMNRRTATTLTEVLVAIFIMGIGLMAILALFPLGAAQMAQALKDQRSAEAAANASALARVIWKQACDADTVEFGAPNPSRPAFRESTHPEALPALDSALCVCDG